VDEMNQALIDNWNAKVGKKDVAYHLGDFSFAGTVKTVEIVKQLNGKIHLVKGNHDYKQSGVALKAFDSVKNLREIKIDDQTIVLCHFPIAKNGWHKAGHGSWHLHGHAHGKRMYDPEYKRLDVGVDVHNFDPISFEDVRDIFSNPEYEYKLRY